MNHLKAERFNSLGWEEGEKQYAIKEMEDAVQTQHDIKAYRLLMWAYEQGARNAVDLLADDLEKDSAISVSYLRDLRDQI